MLTELKKKIVSRKARVSVIGLGYVGLPLAVEFARAGFVVSGIDTDQRRVALLNQGKSYILDVKEEAIRRLARKEKISATSSSLALKSADIILICVPTPLRKTREPDISHILAAARKVGRYFKKGALVILESTTYPGTTRESVLPILEKRGRRLGRDFLLAFSPERVDPGNRRYRLRDIPKVVGGLTPSSTRLAALFYRRIIVKVVSVSSAEVAELAKLLENTFRSVNIALVNELALICQRMKIDVWEVIRAASSKPFGFMRFYPGPGLGGHCLPSDPMYLVWKARLHGYEAKFIELADKINSFMPRFVVAKLKAALGKPFFRSRVLILGVTYKRDVADTRESPALEIMKILRQQGARLSYNDPYVKSVKIGRKKFRSVELKAKTVAAYDALLLITDHRAYNLPRLLKNARLLFDTRNAAAGLRNPKVVRL